MAPLLSPSNRNRQPFIPSSLGSGHEETVVYLLANQASYYPTRPSQKPAARQVSGPWFRLCDTIYTSPA